jgi:hypothetical protein
LECTVSSAWRVDGDRDAGAAVRSIRQRSPGCSVRGGVHVPEAANSAAYAPLISSADRSSAASPVLVTKTGDGAVGTAGGM